MMTFSEDPDFDREQLVRFDTLTGRLTERGVSLGLRHAASSFALFERPEGFLDMVRPGMALYGVYSGAPFRDRRLLDLQPAVSLKSRVAYVKKLTAGESAGYNRAYVARGDVHVATLPVGHADGWPRVAAKGARVAIGGRLYPVIASVSASHTIVEIGSEPAVRIGDVATFFSAAADNRPEDVAQACGASVYDLTDAPQPAPAATCAGRRRRRGCRTRAGGLILTVLLPQPEIAAEAGHYAELAVASRWRRLSIVVSGFSRTGPNRSPARGSGNQPRICLAIVCSCMLDVPS